jgi:hypothetical protein
MNHMHIKLSPFARLFTAFALGLALLCAVLMWLTWQQGPRIRNSTFNSTQAVVSANQQLLLHFSQAPGKVAAGQVDITPKAAFSVVSSGNTVAIQFTQPLNGDTTYKLALRTADGRHTLRHTFQTGETRFYYAVNSQNHTEIKQAGMGRPDTTVFSGDRVTDYLVLGNTLVLAQQPADSTDSWLVLYDLQKKKEKTIELPVVGTVSKLRPLPGKSAFGFVFSSGTAPYTTQIMAYDLARERLQHAYIAEDPVSANDWLFARNGKTFLAKGTDQGVLLVNPGEEPVLLGQFSQLFGFNYDDSVIYMRHALDGVISFNTAGKQRTPVVDDPNIYVGGLAPLSTQDGYVLQTQSAAGGTHTQLVTLVSDKERRALFTEAQSKLYLTAVSLSPNDQYTVVESRVAADNTFKTSIVSTATGKTLKTVPGEMLRWQTGL